MDEQTKNVNAESITADVIVGVVGKEKKETWVDLICERFEAIEARLTELEKSAAGTATAISFGNSFKNTVAELHEACGVISRPHTLGGSPIKEEAAAETTAFKFGDGTKYGDGHTWG